MSDPHPSTFDGGDPAGSSTSTGLLARARQGDATAAEITDAESTLTRAQQANLNSIHDYLIALVRLEYAMGVTPSSSILVP